MSSHNMHQQQHPVRQQQQRPIQMQHQQQRVVSNQAQQPHRNPQQQVGQQQHQRPHPQQQHKSHPSNVQQHGQQRPQQHHNVVHQARPQQHPQGNLHPQQPQQRTANSTAPGQQQQPGQPQQPPLPNPLPKGWKREETRRTKGICAGLVDVSYLAPVPSSQQQQSGETAAPPPAPRRFKSKLELHRYFSKLDNNKYDMALLDYRTGKLSQNAWRKHRRLKSLAANPNNFASAAKYDNYLNLPVRQTASIFKQPVHIVTNHRNEPTPTHLQEKKQQPQQQGGNNPTSVNIQQHQANEKPKPVQLFWELSLNGLKPNEVYNHETTEMTNGVSEERHPQEQEGAVDEEITFDDKIDIPSVVNKFESFKVANETVYRSVAAACYVNSNKLLLGQQKDFGKNCRVFIDRDQPLIPAVAINEDDVKSQEARVKELRKQLQVALKEANEMEIDNDFKSENFKLEVLSH